MPDKLTPEQQKNALDGLMSDNPIVVIYAETGTGKTTFCGTIMEDPRFRKCLYIDIDRSGATIKPLITNPDLCVYRSAKQDGVVGALSLLRWANKEITEAHKHEGVGSIVIEGLARVYQDLTGEMFEGKDDAQLKGYKLQQLYIAAAGRAKAVVANICKLQQRLDKQERSCPIIVTVNTKPQRDDEDRRYAVPALSEAAIEILMGRADAFVQLERRPNKPVKIITDRSSVQYWRKVRHHDAATQIAKLSGPTLPKMFDTWALALGLEDLNVQQHLANENNG